MPRLARATPTNFNSNFFEVPDAWLPSAMFCLPLRAALHHLIADI